MQGADNREEKANKILGELLYADRSVARVSEGDWLTLVESIAKGNQFSLRALYARTHRIVFTLAMRILSNRENAEEVTLDVFQEVWKRAPDYHPANGTVVGWIMNLARSRSIDRLRFEHRKKRVNPYLDEPLANDPLATMVPADNLERDIGVAEQRRALQNGFAVLNAAEREAIEAAFFSDMSYAEVAERLNQPVGTIKTRIRAGLAKLRRAMAPEAEAQ